MIVFIPRGDHHFYGHPSKARVAPNIVAVHGSLKDYTLRTRRTLRSSKIDSQSTSTMDATPRATCGSKYRNIRYQEIVSGCEMKRKLPDGGSQLTSNMSRAVEARPDVVGMYCLSATPDHYQIAWLDPAGPETSPRFDWTDLKPLASYIYSLYKPPREHIVADPTITVSDAATRTDPPTWSVRVDDVLYQHCQMISWDSLFGRRTTVFKHVAKDGCVTIIKDRFRDVTRRSKEDYLLEKIHADGTMPGVVRLLQKPLQVLAEGGEPILTAPRSTHSARRAKIRIVMGSTGRPLREVTSVKQLLMAFFDVVEGEQ